MKKSITFTDDELRTLIWMVQNKYADLIKQSHGITTPTIERVLEIGRKAQAELSMCKLANTSK